MTAAVATLSGAEIAAHQEALRAEALERRRRRLATFRAGQVFFAEQGLNRAEVRALAERLRALYFADRPQHYALWTDWAWTYEDTIAAVAEKGKAFRLRAESWLLRKRPATVEVVEQMLLGRSDTIGAYYLSQQTGQGTKVTLDLDNHDGKANVAAQLSVVTHLLSRLGPCYAISRSKGGKGAHVDLFLDAPVEGAALQALGEEVKRLAALPRKTEVFPKQPRLGGENDFGSQVGLMGSPLWMARTGGAWLLDPLDATPVPIKRWLSTLEGIRPLSAENLLKAVAASIVTCRRPAAPTPAAGTLSGAPTFGTVGDVEGFVEKHGRGFVTKALVGRDGNAKRWTHRLILDECFNAAAHSTADRTDGAAILFSAETGETMYRCHHSGCARFWWADLLRSLGYQVRRRGAAYEAQDTSSPPPRDEDAPRWAGDEDPEEGRVVAWPDPEEDSAVAPAARGRRRAVDPATARTWLRFQKAWKHDRGEQRGRRRVRFGFARLAYKLGRVAKCGKISGAKKCPEHGERRWSPRPCDRELFCPGCADAAREAREAFFLDAWPEEVYLARVDVPQDDFDAIVQAREAAWARCRAQSSRNPCYPRYVEGADHLLLLYPPSLELQAKVVFPEMRRVPRAEAARAASATYAQAQEAFARHEARSQDAQALLEFPLHRQAYRRRTGGSDPACEALPWTDLKRERARAKQRWEEEHPGLEWDQCDVVVEVDAATKRKVFCGLPCCQLRRFDLTGKVFLRKFGPVSEEAEERALDASGEVEAYLANFAAENTFPVP